MAQGAPPSPLQPCPESYSRRWAPPSGWRKTCSPPIRLVAIVTQPCHFSPMGEELPGRAERKGPSMGFFGDTHPSLCVPSPKRSAGRLGKSCLGGGDGLGVRQLASSFVLVWGNLCPHGSEHLTSINRPLRGLSGGDRSAWPWLLAGWESSGETRVVCLRAARVPETPEMLALQHPGCENSDGGEKNDGPVAAL